MREFLNGADAISRAAIRAGCDFFAGYPITPATPILLNMVRDLPGVEGVAIQAEDEIAAMGMCIGAAMAGSRVMTATSGPGISLYSENIGLAIMGEVPMVIVDAQRMGPGTGAATTTAQGDIQFLRWGTSGGYPVIVLAPSSVADCYRLTMVAFDLAERFRSPVFLATDKEMVLGRTTVAVEDLKDVPVRERNWAVESEAFVPYPEDAPDGVPAMAAYGGPHVLRFTTSSHDAEGYLTKAPAAVGALNTRLASKIEDHLGELEFVQEDLVAEARTLVISYGTTARAAREAVRTARTAGHPISHLIVESIWPVPEDAIRRAARGVEQILVPELNLGQYAREVERVVRGACSVVPINRVDGHLITPTEILEKGGLT